MLGRDIFHSLFPLLKFFLVRCRVRCSMFDEVDKIEKGVDGDLVIAFGKARSRAE